MKHGKVSALCRVVCLVLTMTAGISLKAQENLFPLTVELYNRSINKLPFVIAFERGLYKKYGLDVTLWMPDPAYNARLYVGSTAEIDENIGIKTQIERPEDAEITVDAATPMMVAITRNARAKAQHRIAVASTDCVVRWHIIARDGINRLEDLKGQRLGVSGPGAMTDYTARLLSQRMGWDPVQDITIMASGTSIEALQNGWVDAFVASEVPLAFAEENDIEPLADLRTWKEPIAGNSVRVKRDWLNIPSNRQAIKHFLMATIEAISLFHQNRGEIAYETMSKWHGISDRRFASIVYAGGSEMPRKPFPCIDGIKKTMELYDSNEMRRYKAEDFYDDSLMKEIDESGFIESLSM